MARDFFRKFWEDADVAEQERRDGGRATKRIECQSNNRTRRPIVALTLISTDTNFYGLYQMGDV